MPDRQNQDLDARQRQLEETVDLPPAVGRFVAAVDALVDKHLNSDEVEGRLERVRRDAEHSTLAGPEWSHEDPNWRGFATESAQHGYHIVQVWLRIVLVWIRADSAIGGQRVELTEEDIDELAQETVARAISSFRDEAQRSGQWPSEDAIELRTTFLTQCIRQLPHAYRSSMLKRGRLPVDKLDELAGHQTGVLVVRALRHCVTDRRSYTAGLLRSWGYTSREGDEIVGMTLAALDLAAAEHAKLGGPPPTIPPHSDQAVER